MSVAIDIKNLYFKYQKDSESIFEDANFGLNYGEVALLYGMSGCGKSTLFHLINGIIPYSTPGYFKGSLKIDEENLIPIKIVDRTKRVASVLQNPECQIVYEKVEDEIAFSMENHAVSQDVMRNRVSELIEQFKLPRLTRTRKLSGGEKQRLIFSSAIGMEQKIIILDEPLANLDKHFANEILKYVRALADNGYAVLVIEHRLDVLIDYIDVAWRIENKKLVKVANKNELESSRYEISSLEGKALEDKTILSLKDIDLVYGKREILKNVNLDIKKGEKLLILGDNGKGKTTLLNIIGKLLKPTKGRVYNYIYHDKHQSKKGNAKWFSHVGYVFQDPNYQLFNKTVYEEIAFGANDKTFVDYIIDLFNLKSLLERHPHSLSEGQKRRVTIASILAQKPALLLLDEPTVGQDDENLKMIVYGINEVHNKLNNTMVTITHDLRCAGAFATRCILVEDKNIKEISIEDIEFKLKG